MREHKPLRVVATGLRGVPEIQGGVETHAQNLYPYMVGEGYEITIYGRRAFLENTEPYEWAGLKVIPTWAPKSTSLEAIGHTAVAVLYSAFKRPDVIHIHGVGPALVTPLARLFGLKTVVTHHGRTYESDKWGNFAKKLLKAGETLAMRFANRVICVAQNDAKRLNEKFHSDKATAIPNGLPKMHEANQPELLKELGIECGRYVLHVGRIVPEKRQVDLIEAFEKANMQGWKLVFVGSAMHASVYANSFDAAVSVNSDVVAAGQRSEQALATLYGGAGMFVLPSKLEGLPISILEALGFGLPCLVSKIPANMEFGLPKGCYFNAGNTDEMAQKMTTLSSMLEPRDTIFQSDLDRVPERYHWESIARSTMSVIQEVANRNPSEQPGQPQSA
jgi:glycosyltransferase involved in cell wall biosynthesis